MALLANLFPPSENKDDLEWTYTDKPHIFAKFSQCTTLKSQQLDTDQEVAHKILPSNSITIDHVTAAAATKSVHTSKRASPMQIIIQLSENDAINADYMKSSLINFISKKEFQKIFGIKKTAEVMKGITENKWNKSLVLFISFMYDTAFIYLNKDVVYDTNYSYDNKVTI